MLKYYPKSDAAENIKNDVDLNICYVYLSFLYFRKFAPALRLCYVRQTNNKT